jgi:hypothetical protein
MRLLLYRYPCRLVLHKKHTKDAIEISLASGDLQFYELNGCSHNSIDIWLDFNANSPFDIKFRWIYLSVDASSVGSLHRRQCSEQILHGQPKNRTLGESFCPLSCCWSYEI